MTFGKSFEEISTTVTINEMGEIVATRVDEVLDIMEEAHEDRAKTEAIAELLLKFSATLMAKMFVLDDGLEIINE